MNDPKQEGLLCVSYMIGHSVTVTMCKSHCIFQQFMLYNSQGDLLCVPHNVFFQQFMFYMLLII